MRLNIFAIGALMVVSLGCSNGELVTFNQRLFAADSMESQGGGCSTFEIGGTDGQAGGGGTALDLFVSMKETDDALIVEVLRGPVVISSKTYGVPFFRAGTVDEYIAASSSGSRLLLRHWGTLGGHDTCTPLDQDSPTPPTP
jgi:hypothetical protein